MSYDDQHIISSFNSFENSSSFEYSPRKRLPPVPKFGNDNVLTHSMNNPAQEKTTIKTKTVENTNFASSSGPIIDKPAQTTRMEEEVRIISPVYNGIPLSMLKNQNKEDQANNKAPTQKKPIGFAPEINFDLINKLYANKKELAQKEAKEEKKPEQSAKNDNVAYHFQKQRDEYDPARPNDYEAILEERRRKSVEQEEIKRKEQDKMQEEQDYLALDSDKPNFSKYPVMKDETEMEEEEPSIEEKAMKMLEKSGWKMGEGLGKNKQGMTTPLIAKKTAGNTAVIMNSSVDMTHVLPPEIVAKKAREALYNIPPTRILVLLNMVGPNDPVDEQLRDEVMEECQNYGRVFSCEICEVKNVPVEESIRIFVEFDRKESAVNAFGTIYGRFFAGRTIFAKFYDERAYMDKNLYLPI